MNDKNGHDWNFVWNHIERTFRWLFLFAADQFAGVLAFGVFVCVSMVFHFLGAAGAGLGNVFVMVAKTLEVTSLLAGAALLCVYEYYRAVSFLKHLGILQPSESTLGNPTIEEAHEHVLDNDNATQDLVGPADTVEPIGLGSQADPKKPSRVADENAKSQPANGKS